MPTSISKRERACGRVFVCVCVCVCMCACVYVHAYTGGCVVQDQAPQQWWSIRSALQPDRWCNSRTNNMCMRI